MTQNFKQDIKEESLCSIVFYLDGLSQVNITHLHICCCQSIKIDPQTNCVKFFLLLSIGCVLVYRIYPPNYDDRTSSHYCNRLVYFYAFWLVTSTFIIFGLFMGCLCCLTLSSMLAGHPQ